MKARASVGEPKGRSDMTGVIAKGSVRVGVLILVMAVALFISSGRLDWVMAWVDFLASMLTKWIVNMN